MKRFSYSHNSVGLVGCGFEDCPKETNFWYKVPMLHGKIRVRVPLCEDHARRVGEECLVGQLVNVDKS